MDIDDFQNRMSYTSVFQNFGSLAQNWVPSEKEKLLCRDREIDHMISLFRPIIVEDAPFSANLLVLGGGGVGKTVTVKYFAKNFRDFARKTTKITIEYYDCLQHKTKSAILRDMVGKVNFSSGHGFSDPELMKQILMHLKSTNQYLLIILDEVHNLPPEDIMAFLNASQAFGQANSRFSIIAITRSMDWMKVRDEKMESRIQSTLMFEPYREEEAFRILRYRANLAFRIGVIDDDAIKLISSIVRKTGNMRTGIEILIACGQHCDQNRLSVITPEIILQSRNIVNPEFKKDIFTGLKREELFAALALIRTIESTTLGYATIDKSYETFNLILEEYGEEPKVIQTFYRYVDDLVKRRIFNSTMAKKRGKAKGQEKRIQLLDIDPKSLKEYIETLLGAE